MNLAPEVCFIGAYKGLVHRAMPTLSFLLIPNSLVYFFLGTYKTLVEFDHNKKHGPRSVYETYRYRDRRNLWATALFIFVWRGCQNMRIGNCNWSTKNNKGGFGELLLANDARCFALTACASEISTVESANDCGKVELKRSRAASQIWGLEKQDAMWFERH